MKGALRRILAHLDALVNRLYGWRLNPLYHSGAIAFVMLVVLLVTGIYLLFFYRVSAPYESVVGLHGQVWAGRWIRALHRYAGDVGMVAVVVHAVRMFVQGRSWGPRALAWLSGVLLFSVFLIAGWTGFVMIWDTHGQLLAAVGASMLDLMPIFSEPIGRTFVAERALPSAFFFLNLFAHIALPVGLLLLLWIHVSRLARPTLFPPRRLSWALVIGLTVLSVLWAPAIGPQADLLRIPADAPLDVFFSFWLPFAERTPPYLTLGLATVAGVALLLVPVWTRARPDRAPPASTVDERLCTGCEQCYVDCPYEAIAMVARTDDRPTPVARVDPSLCVSCGICAGSCAPMGVGPPGRTGRDQLRDVRAFIDERPPGSRDIVLVACDRGAGRHLGDRFEGSRVLSVTCAGNLHTSVIEFLVRSGAPGVLVAACPPRDCWSREGPKWLRARMYEDREAELQERVDRARVDTVYAGEAEAHVVREALDAFRSRVGALSMLDADEAIDIMALCERAEAESEVEV